MRAELAMRLLSDLMEWDNSRVTREFAWLGLMVEYKYDHYQGFSSGSRFFVNLLNWLSQFKDIERRQIAYDFVRQQMVYVSQREMRHLVSLSRPVLQRDMRRAVAKELDIAVHETWNDPAALKRLRLMEIRTLYVGLSDGARIDFFRRDNEGIISNEQVVAAPELSAEKWASLQAELKNRLSGEYAEQLPSFERICLIDDFTASGSTLIRQDAAPINGWNGKVPRFCRQNKSKVGTVIAEHCVLHIHHYLASERAAKAIWEQMLAYGLKVPEFTFHCSVSSILSNSIAIGDHSDPQLTSLLRSHYDPSIETESLGKDVWYGYKQCGLPIVLEHNTPNNSIALLWATSKPDSEAPNPMRPLFSRKHRHT